MVAKVSEQERIEQINAKPNIKFVRWDGEFKGGKSKVVCRCEIDGYEWSSSVGSLIGIGTGCPQCSGQRRWTADERIDQINNRPNITFVRWDGEFKGRRTKAICRCEIDGYEWSTGVDSLVNNGAGCPRCGGNRKLTADERIDQINALPNIKFVRWDGEFKGATTKAVCRCEIDGYEWSASVDRLVNGGTGCPQCSGNRKWTANERVEQINALPNIRFVRWDGEFKGATTRLICRCEIDGYEWSSSVSNLVDRGRGCPQCAGMIRLTSDERIEQINALPNIRFVRWDGEFKGNKTKAVCRCEIDGCEWSAAVRSLINRGTGCPYCARYGKTEEQPAPNVTVEIPTDVKPAFDLLNW